MSKKPQSRRLSVEDVKTAASGRWSEILNYVAGIPAEALDGKGHPCPKCGGTDRFSLIDEAAGAIHCRKCFAKHNGDGLAAVAWMCGGSFPDAIKLVAEYLDLTPKATPHPRSHNSQNSSSPDSQGSSGNNGSAKPRIAQTYDYRDEAGKLIFQVVRYEPKAFRQRRRKTGGGWDWSVKGVRVVPFRLPELLADANQPAIVVEGEKDANALARHGILATCNAGGAGKWTAEHSEFLRGRSVVVMCDNDEAGRSHGQQVAQSLYGVAKWIRVIELPDLPPKGDVSDWLAAGGSVEELKRLSRATEYWIPSAAQEPWPELQKLDRCDLPEFPTQVLPQALREWVEAEARAMQVPADLPALLSLSVCAFVTSRKVEIEPRPGWCEPTNLFTVTLLPPANRKSAVFKDATLPLKEIEAQLIESARPEYARSLSERRQDEIRLRKLEKIAGEKPGQDGDEARHKACELAEALALKDEPVLPRLIVDDVTSEQLGIMLAEQGGKLASMSPEGGVFDLMSGLYSKSGIAQFDAYLKGHSGDDLITDRVSRKSVRVERPSVVCGFAIQPQVIEGLAGKAAFRGRGLLGRFLYSLPRSPIGERMIAPPSVPTEIAENYRQAVRTMLERVDQFQTGLAEPLILRLSQKALILLERWEEEIEEKLAEGGEMELITDWGGKLAGATVRVAAVLHCVEHGPAGEIGSRSIQAAIEIARYLVPHAAAALNLMEAKEGESTDDNAAYILRWIKRHERLEFTRSEAQHHGKQRFPMVDAIDEPLAELVKRGYIRQKPSAPARPGRPPSPAYEVNPAVFADTKPEYRSQNSRNLSESSDNGNSGNCGSALEQSKITNRERMTI